MAICSLDQYLDGLSSQLKDCTQTVNGKVQNIRWTRDHLTWILCIAAKQLQEDRGDLFLEDHRIKLNVGCYTEVCAQGCTDIRQPIVLEGNECERISINSDKDTWANDFFQEFACSLSDSSEYKIDSIDIDPEDPCKIKISPPVPDDGVQRYIVARCSQDVAGEIEGGTLPQGVCNAIHPFTLLVLAYAYGMDDMVNVDGNKWKVYHDEYQEVIQDSFIRKLSLRDPRVLFAQVSRNLGE